MQLETPADVIHELASIRDQSAKGIALLAEAEQKQVRLELEADRQEYVAYIEAKGTIPDREAISKLRSQDAREAAEIARIEVSRIKTKLKHLSEAMMATQTAARMVELEWKTTR